MSIIFRLKRPLKHFVANKRGNGRLKDNAPNALSAELRTDVDNLAKFVLDSCNELLYEDDKQIVSLHITKIYDNDDICLGSTEICLRSITTTRMGSVDEAVDAATIINGDCAAEAVTSVGNNNNAVDNPRQHKQQDNNILIIEDLLRDSLAMGSSFSKIRGET